MNCVAMPLSGACTKLVPGVDSSAPRMFWKPLKMDGDTVIAAPPPSQLISRRPPASGPAALPLFGLPAEARNASTAAWMAAALAPDAEVVIGALRAGTTATIHAAATITQTEGTCLRSIEPSFPCR